MCGLLHPAMRPRVGTPESGSAPSLEAIALKVIAGYPWDGHSRACFLPVPRSSTTESPSDFRLAWHLGGSMGQLVRRLRSCETGSALTEYGLMIAVVALGLVATLGVFRNAAGGMTSRTSGTISRQSGHTYGSRGGGVPRGVMIPVEAAPARPDSSSGDSTAVATGSSSTAARR
jgi:Flp pilus assembly pilin Flp